MRAYPLLLAGLLLTTQAQAQAVPEYVAEAGHSSLKGWLLPAMPSSPPDNLWTPAKAELGKQLFFDPRLSGTGQVTCVSCHLPERGWEDGLPTAVRFGGKVMSVASPTIVNVGYNSIFMWDGRMSTLEAQAFGGQGIKADINALSEEYGVKEGAHIERIKAVKGYQTAFAKAFPEAPADQKISRDTIAKALASFERTVVSRTSPFDRWVKGERAAMTGQQINGFKVFVGKGGCVVCHAAPNFTDDGFHNVGLKSFADPGHHKGRMTQMPGFAKTDGAFKTPTLRDIALRAPYFHDGSARTLMDVVEHYDRGGDVKTHLAVNMKSRLELTAEEKQALVVFMEALTSPQKPFVYPVLPAR